MEVPGGDWVFTGVDRQGAMFAAHSKKRVTAKEAPRRPRRTTKHEEDHEESNESHEGHAKKTAYEVLALRRAARNRATKRR